MMLKPNLASLGLGARAKADVLHNGGKEIVKRPNLGQSASARHCPITKIAVLENAWITCTTTVKLAPSSRQDLIRRLRSLGWSGPYSGAKHQHMVKDNIQLTIPNPHGGREIGVNLLKIILNEAGISRDEWLNAR